MKGWVGRADATAMPMSTFFSDGYQAIGNVYPSSDKLVEPRVQWRKWSLADSSSSVAINSN